MIITVLCFINSELSACFNPYMTNGLFRPYHLDASISNLGVSGVLIHFYYILNRNSCKQTVKTQIRCRVLCLLP